MLCITLGLFWINLEFYGFHIYICTINIWRYIDCCMLVVVFIALKSDNFIKCIFCSYWNLCFSGNYLYNELHFYIHLHSLLFCCVSTILFCVFCFVLFVLISWLWANEAIVLQYAILFHMWGCFNFFEPFYKSDTF